MPFSETSSVVNERYWHIKTPDGKSFKLVSEKDLKKMLRPIEFIHIEIDPKQPTGKQVKELRKKRVKLSQRKLAKISKVTHTQISRIEAGIIEPHKSTIRHLLNVIALYDMGIE